METGVTTISSISSRSSRLSNSPTDKDICLWWLRPYPPEIYLTTLEGQASQAPDSYYQIELSLDGPVMSL